MQWSGRRAKETYYILFKLFRVSPSTSLSTSSASLSNNSASAKGSGLVGCVTFGMSILQVAGMRTVDLMPGGLGCCWYWIIRILLIMWSRKARSYSRIRRLVIGLSTWWSCIRCSRYSELINCYQRVCCTGHYSCIAETCFGIRRGTIGIGNSVTYDDCVPWLFMDEDGS